MGGVTRGLCGAIAVAWLITVGVDVLAQPGPAAVPAEAKTMKSAVASTPESIQAGSKLYAKYCRFCHGTTGKGDSPMAPKNVKPSDLTDTAWIHGSSEGEIFWVIQNGAPPKYDMKGLKGKISDQDTWHLVNYVRSLGGVTKSH